MQQRPGSQEAAEAAAIFYGLTGPDEARRVLGCITPEDFLHPVLARAARAMAEGLDRRRWISLADVMTRLGEADGAVLSALAERHGDLAREPGYVDDCLEQLKMDKVRRRLDQIKQELLTAENEAQKLKLKQEFRNLSMNYKGVKREYRREEGYDD